MTGPPDPHDTEGTVDRLEEKILGHRVDQTRDDAADQTAADGSSEDTGPGAEPTD